MTILATGLEVVASVLLIWHGWRNYSGAKSTAKAAGAVDNANKGNNTVYYVTPDGIVVKNRIPDNYIDNPYRSGSYGILDENGKYVEKLRIDPATSPGKKGPDYSHYHVDGGKEHFSSRPGDNNPLGF